MTVPVRHADRHPDPLAGENLEDWTTLADFATPDSWTGIDG
jgi:hypothetical protein